MSEKNVQPTKRADELKPGDWVTNLGNSLGGGHAELLTVHSYADDHGCARVLLTFVETGYSSPQVARMDADDHVWILTEEMLAEARSQAERAQRIADIRKLADWLEERPWMPLLDLDVNRHLYGLDGYRTVVEMAERLGVPLEKTLDDRTRLVFRKGPLTFTLLVWHKDGRPAEPAPAAVEDDPTGLNYTRAETDEDDPTPVSPARGLHIGAVTEGGLVDETPAEAAPGDCTCWATSPNGCPQHAVSVAR
jgi:hypothetical protein